MNNFLVNLNSSEFLEEIKQKILGKTVKDANKILGSTGYYVYPVLINGEPCHIIYNLDFTRVNVEVDNELITKVGGVG